MDNKNLYQGQIRMSDGSLRALYLEDVKAFENVDQLRAELARVTRQRDALHDALGDLKKTVKDDLLPAVRGEAPDPFIGDVIRIEATFEKVDTALNYDGDEDNQ